MSTPERPHDRLEELIALDALDGLDATERAELDAALGEHGPDCEGCAELFAAYAEAAAVIAFTAPPQPLSPSSEERLIAAARARDPLDPATGGTPASRARPASPPALTVLPGGGEDARGRSEPPTVAAEGRAGNRRWVAWSSVAAALVIGITAGFIAAPKAPSGTTRFLSFAAQPGTRFAAFPTSDGQSLTVAYQPGQTDAWIFGSGMTKPSGGKTYELWWGSKGTQLAEMSPAGTFVPIHGNVVAPVAIGASGPGTVLGVTIEPPGGSSSPTTDPVFVTTV